MNAGKTIKELRLSHNMTQEELGEILGVKKAAVQKYESGAVALKADMIRKLCDIFHVYPWRFIYEDKIPEYTRNKSIDMDAVENFISWVRQEYGEEFWKMYTLFGELNGSGRAKVLQYIKDLSFSPENIDSPQLNKTP